jgi:hypothetical protein
VLRDQLDVTEDVFWACARDNVAPNRAMAPTLGDGLPAGVVHQLIKYGVPEREVAEMTRAEALQRLHDFWSGE